LNQKPQQVDQSINRLEDLCLVCIQSWVESHFSDYDSTPVSRFETPDTQNLKDELRLLLGLQKLPGNSHQKGNVYFHGYFAFDRTQMVVVVTCQARHGGTQNVEI